MSERMDVAMADLRDALQRAQDGEAPDSIMEELRQPFVEGSRRPSWEDTNALYGDWPGPVLGKVDCE